MLFFVNFQGEEMATFKFPLSKIVVGSNDLSIKLQSYELPDWKGRIRFAAQLRYLAKPINKGKYLQGLIHKLGRSEWCYIYYTNTNKFDEKNIKACTVVGLATLLEGAGCFFTCWKVKKSLKFINGVKKAVKLEKIVLSLREKYNKNIDDV